jgi:hypothetical protein
MKQPETEPRGSAIKFRLHQQEKCGRKKTIPLQNGFYSRTKRKARKLYKLFSFQLTAFTNLFFYRRTRKTAVIFLS